MKKHVSFVYIIQSKKSGSFYIGCSGVPLRRLGEHNSGKVKSTKNKGPWELKLVQEYETMQKAKKIEHRLKKLKRRDYIIKILEDGIHIQ